MIETQQTLKIAVLVSGSGTTLQFLLDAIQDGKLQVQICAVFADRPCLALERAVIAGLPSQLLSRKALAKDILDAALAAALEQCGCHLVLLAGYLSVIGPKVLASSAQGQIWNLHPSLLPKYSGIYGIHIHRAVLKAREAETGCTLHQVSAVIDGGPILAQRQVHIADCQTAEQIATRVQNLEKQLLLEYLKIYLQ